MIEKREADDDQNTSFVIQMENGRETIRHRSHNHHNVTQYTKVTETKKSDLTQKEKLKNKTKKEEKKKQRGRGGDQGKERKQSQIQITHWEFHQGLGVKFLFLTQLLNPQRAL